MNNSKVASKSIIAIVRIRGKPGQRAKANKTLELLNLHKPNHMILVPDTSSYRGMLQKVNHLVAWGYPKYETVVQLIKKRGEVKGNGNMSKEAVKEKSNGKYQNIEEIAEIVWKGKRLKEIKWIKPVLRLHPPSGGYKSTKTSFQEGGSYGSWGENIDKLLKRML